MSARSAAPEMQALLAVARRAVRRELDHGPVEHAAFDGIDWPVLLKLARQHRLLPLLDRFAAPAGIQVPEPIRPSLSRESAGSAARNLYMTAELITMMDALRQEGVQAASYKGPIVSLWAYGELGLRPFADLDILVKRRQLRLAAATLRAHGFHLQHPTADSDRVLALRTEYHFPYYREKGGLVIELHSRLAPYYFLSQTESEPLLDRSVSASFGFGSVPVLCAEDLLLALCIHGAKHAWEWLAMVTDISLLARSPDIVWDALMFRAREVGADRMLAVSLGLARELAEISVPAELRRAIASNETAVLIQAAMSRWQPGGSEPRVLYLPALHWKTFQRNRDRVRYALLAVLAPNWNDIEWRLLPRVLFPLYWLLRPLRLMVQRVPPVIRFCSNRWRRPQATSGGNKDPIADSR